MNLKDKIVVVTGASSGIGDATARAFAAAGAKVALVARRVEKLTALAAELNTDTLVVATDITHDDDVNRMVAAVVAKWGRIDILVNNAGVARGGALIEMTPEEIRLVLDTNVYGTIRVTQAVLPHIPKGGHIVNVSSVAGEIGAPGQIVYGASKAAMNLFGDGLRRELKDCDIYVTTLMPGWTRTPMVDGIDLDELRAIGLYNRLFVLDEPETTAQRIVRTVVRRERRVIMGGFGFWIGVTLGRIAPRLMDIYWGRYRDIDRLTRAMRMTLR